MPDNNFFWTVLYSIARDSVLTFIEDTMAERKKKQEHLNKQVKLAIDETFMDELLKYDFVSSKKGKRLGTVLLEKKLSGAKHLMRQRAQHQPNQEM